MSSLKKKYNKEVAPAMQKRFGYANVASVPRISKVVVSIGTGRIRDNKSDIEEVVKALSAITGQKLAPRAAKKSIAAFKTRQGEIIGYMVTLRGNRMYDFLERLVSVAFPRGRDFRGISLKKIDESGNLNVGIREHIIFPEMVGEDVRKLFGFQITVVVKNVKSRDEVIEFYRLMGFPLKKS